MRGSEIGWADLMNCGLDGYSRWWESCEGKREQE